MSYIKNFQRNERKIGNKHIYKHLIFDERCVN